MSRLFQSGGLRRKKTEIDPLAVLNALPHPLIVVDDEGYICMTNPAGEEFFGLSAKKLLRLKIAEVVPFDSPLINLIEQVRGGGDSVAEYDVDLGTPKIGIKNVNLQVFRLYDTPNVVIQIAERTIADKMDRQLTHRGAARSV